MKATTSRRLPSAIEICLAERFTPARARKFARDKTFVRELQDQALNDLSVFPYVDTLDCTEPLDPNDFILYASNDLSPFLPDGKCVCAPCRTRYSRAFARGVGLYAEIVVLSDHFSGAVIKTPPDQWSPDDFADWIEQLQCLEPLMRGGVIRFARWIYSRCGSCGDVSRRAEGDVARRLLDDIWRTPGLQFEYGIPADGLSPAVRVLSLSSPVMSGPEGPLGLRCGMTKTFERMLLQAERAARKGDGTHPTIGKKIESYLRPRVLPELRRFADTAIFSLTMGQLCNATIATDSLLGARVMSYLDELDVQPAAVRKRWELPPTSELPWLQELDPQQVIEVRTEAHRALPAFRSLLRSQLFTDDKQRPSTLVDLRAQASEVENELRQLRVVKRRSTLLSLSGLLMAVYGFGTRDPSMIAAGLGGFLSTLAAGHASATGVELKEHGLVHKPAYILLSARSAAHRKRVQ